MDQQNKIHWTRSKTIWLNIFSGIGSIATVVAGMNGVPVQATVIAQGVIAVVNVILRLGTDRTIGKKL